MIHARSTICGSASAAATPSAPAGPSLGFGAPAIDDAIPGGGLALHEAAGVGLDTEYGAAPARLIASLISRRPGPVLWVTAGAPPFAPALAGVGLHPDRVIYLASENSAYVNAAQLVVDGGLTATVR